MSAHEEEATVRGHGPRPACDHDGARVDLLAQPAVWCSRCGALYTTGNWIIPSQRVPDSTAIRDRDTMHETLTIAQERCTALVEEVRLLKAQLMRGRFA